MFVGTNAQNRPGALDHCLHHLMGNMRNADGSWMEEEQAEAVLHRLRSFSKDGEPVFQSYHAAGDPDSWRILPSGTVGIPPVVSAYLSLAYAYLEDHGFGKAGKKHFWSLIGDSEFREGSLMEALPDIAERELGNITWIIDYNRQNLDGTRIPNERGLEGTDCDRIERTAIANGWRVIHLRHGSAREELFKRSGGERLKAVLESGISDYEFQLLALTRDAGRIREAWLNKDPELSELLGSMDDEEILAILQDLGGHDMDRVIAALRASKEEPGEPFIIIAHTFKGWGLECLADPANHSTLPAEAEVHQVLAEAGLSPERPFERFSEDSDEAEWLRARRDLFRTARTEHEELAEKNMAAVRASVEEGGGLPTSLDIDRIVPLFALQEMPTGLRGLVFAGLFAAIMSTADSFLNIGAAAIVHDIPRAIRGRSLNNELLWARVATVVIAAVASGVALASGKMVALLGAVGWSVFSGAIVPTVAIGFNWKRATPLACNLAILTSLGINLGLQVFSVTLPHLFYNGALALLASLTVFYVVSIASPPPTLDPDIEAAMDL